MFFRSGLTVVVSLSDQVFFGNQFIRRLSGGGAPCNLKHGWFCLGCGALFDSVLLNFNLLKAKMQKT